MANDDGDNGENDDKDIIVGKKKKLSESELDEIAESITSFSPGEPEEKYTLDNVGLFDVAEKKEEKKERKPVSTGGLGEWEPPKKGTEKGYRSNEEETEYKASLPIHSGTMSISDEQAEEIRKEREFKWKEQGKLPGETAIEATYRKVTTNPLDIITGAKGYASETKLKWEASKYGITPQDFKKLKEGGSITVQVTGPKGGKRAVSVKGLHGAYSAIMEGKKNEAMLKAQEAAIKQSEATTKSIGSSTATRYAALEQAQVPKGGHKLVQFGWKEGSYGQEPIYMTQRGSHGAVRSQFVPNTGAGVKSSIARSRLGIAKMQQRALSGVGTGGIRAIQFLQPTPNVQRPTIISKLSGKASNTMVRLPSLSQQRPGPSILQKLGFKRKLVD